MNVFTESSKSEAFRKDFQMAVEFSSVSKALSNSGGKFKAEVSRLYFKPIWNWQYLEERVSRKVKEYFSLIPLTNGLKNLFLLGLIERSNPFLCLKRLKRIPSGEAQMESSRRLDNTMPCKRVHELRKGPNTKGLSVGIRLTFQFPKCRTVRKLFGNPIS